MKSQLTTNTTVLDRSLNSTVLSVKRNQLMVPEPEGGFSNRKSEARLSTFDASSKSSLILAKVKRIPLKFEGLTCQRQKKIKAFQAFQDQFQASKFQARAVTPMLDSHPISPINSATPKGGGSSHQKTREAPELSKDAFMKRRMTANITPSSQNRHKQFIHFQDQLQPLNTPMAKNADIQSTMKSPCFIKSPSPHVQASRQEVFDAFTHNIMDHNLRTMDKHNKFEIIKSPTRPARPQRRFSRLSQHQGSKKRTSEASPLHMSKNVSVFSEQTKDRLRLGPQFKTALNEMRQIPTIELEESLSPKKNPLNHFYNIEEEASKETPRIGTTSTDLNATPTNLDGAPKLDLAAARETVTSSEESSFCKPSLDASKFQETMNFLDILETQELSATLKKNAASGQRAQELLSGNLVRSKENRQRLREWSRQQKIKNQLERIAAVKASKADKAEDMSQQFVKMVTNTQSIQRKATSIVLPEGETEYTYSENDPANIKLKKSLQRQLNLDQIINQNPVLIGADPRILSLNCQPKVSIIDFKSMRRDKVKRNKAEENCRAEDKIIRLTGIEFHKQINRQQVHDTFQNNLPQRSKSYALKKSDVQTKHITQKRKTVSTEATKEKNHLTYHDFTKYFCNFDKDIEMNQTEQLHKLVAKAQEYVRDYIDEVQENSSSASSFNTDSEIMLHGSISEGSRNSRGSRLEEEQDLFGQKRELEKNQERDVEHLFKTFKLQRRLVKARDNRRKQYRQALVKLKTFIDKVMSGRSTVGMATFMRADPTIRTENSDGPESNARGDSSAQSVDKSSRGKDTSELVSLNMSRQIAMKKDSADISKGGIGQKRNLLAIDFTGGGRKESRKESRTSKVSRAIKASRRESKTRNLGKGNGTDSKGSLGSRMSSQYTTRSKQGGTNTSSLTRQAKKKKMIDDEISRVKMEFSDVIGVTPDLSHTYNTRMPEWLSVSKDSAKKKRLSLAKKMTKTQINRLEDRAAYEDYFMRMKKKLDLDLIKENEETELLNEITAIIRPGQNREDQKQKYNTLQRRAKLRILLDKLEEEEQELERKRKETKEARMSEVKDRTRAERERKRRQFGTFIGSLQPDC